MTIYSTQLLTAAAQVLRKTPIYLGPSPQFVAHGTSEAAAPLKDVPSAVNYQLDLSETAVLCSQHGDGPLAHRS